MKRGVLLTCCALACANLGSPEQPFRERPYVWASEGRVELSSCRWLLDAPIGVALASDASAEEEHALEAVLRAFERTLPGLRFVRTGGGAIAVRFVDGPVLDAEGEPAGGRNVTDCRLGVSGARAALVAARLEIARQTPPDWRGRERALSLEERAGALAHELGHALGVPGHAAGKSDLMAATGGLASTGAGVLAGERLPSASLAALYARPPGEVLQSAAVDAWRTFELDRLARLAGQHPLDGPYLRAGEAVGRIFWRDSRGREWGFLVAGLAELSADPRQLLLLPEASTRNALPRREAPSGG